MWTSDLSNCWLNTPDVRTADDDDVVGGLCAATVSDQVDDLPVLDDFDVAADPSGQSFHHADVTFQPANINDPHSSATLIPLPVLQFYDTDAPLEEQLVTPPVLKKTTQPDFNRSDGRVSVPGVGLGQPDNGLVSSLSTFDSPLSEPRQEHFILIQLPPNANDLISGLSRVTNNNELVVNNNYSSFEDHRYHRQQQPEPTSEKHVSTSTAAAAAAAAEPCSRYRLQTSGDATGSDVTRLSEEDVMRMLDDAASIVVGKIYVCGFR